MSVRREKIKYQLDNFPFRKSGIWYNNAERISMLESFINGDMSALAISNAIGDLPGGSVDSVRSFKKRFMKRFVEPEISIIIDDPLVKRRELTTVEEKLKRITKGNKDIIVVDPHLGLHSLIADVENIMQDNMVDHGNTMRYIALKAKIFELIIKHGNKDDISLDLDEMKRKTDMISLFVFDIASRIEQLIKDIGEEFSMKYNRAMVENLMLEFSRRLDVKQLYLEFIENVGDDFDE